MERQREARQLSAVYLDYDQASLDAEYNARAAVPDHEDYFARYRELSERTRAKVECRLDVAYGPSAMERLDVFPAAGNKTWIFIHGGWWRSLDKADFSFVADGFRDAGVTTICVNYALAPSVRIAEIVRQARAATKWVLDHASEWGGAAESVYVGGHSAGGHLSLLSAVTEAVAGVATISGVHDLEPVFLSYVNEWAQLRRDEVADLSPLFHLPQHALPLVAAVGAEETDEFVRQNALIARAWRERGYPVSEMKLQGHNHFSVVLDLQNSQSRLTQAVLTQMQ
jgi:arylformamidase